MAARIRCASRAAGPRPQFVPTDSSCVGVWECGSMGVSAVTPTLPYSHTHIRPYPCLCLCLGFLQMTRTTPSRLMILHFSQIFLTDALTFMALSSTDTRKHGLRRA